jgi:TolA-binding protein
LLVVPFTYDYPELSAIALVEAARTLTELKQQDQAARLLQRVIKDHPESQWAKVARERLDARK